MFKDDERGQTHYCEACEWESGRPKTTAMPIHTCGKGKCNCQYEQGHSIACPLYKERAFKPSWEDNFCKTFKDIPSGVLAMMIVEINDTIKTEREQAVKEVLDLLPKEYEGELDDFSSGFNICRNEIELKINKLKAKYK